MAIKGKTGKKLADFKAHLMEDAPWAAQEPELAKLAQDVEDFAKTFPTVGFDEGSMRYP